jgi:hypothetical protein
MAAEQAAMDLGKNFIMAKAKLPPEVVKEKVEQRLKAANFDVRRIAARHNTAIEQGTQIWVELLYPRSGFPVDILQAIATMVKQVGFRPVYVHPSPWLAGDVREFLILIETPFIADPPTAWAPETDAALQSTLALLGKLVAIRKNIPLVSEAHHQIQLAITHLESVEDRVRRALNQP